MANGSPPSPVGSTAAGSPAGWWARSKASRGPWTGDRKPTIIMLTTNIQTTPRDWEHDGSMNKNGPEARLLVVDDEPNIRELLSTSLRFAGFEVVSAANGRDALAAADTHAPDLAVLDVMLPDMDGFTVTRRLRASGKHFPVLFLTAKDDTEDKVTGLTVGGDDYVTKPFSLDEVVARIRAVLRRTQPLQDDDAVIRVDDLELDDH